MGLSERVSLSDFFSAPLSQEAKKQQIIIVVKNLFVDFILIEFKYASSLMRRFRLYLKVIHIFCVDKI